MKQLSLYFAASCLGIALALAPSAAAQGNQGNVNQPIPAAPGATSGAQAGGAQAGTPTTGATAQPQPGAEAGTPGSAAPAAGAGTQGTTGAAGATPYAGGGGVAGAQGTTAGAQARGARGHLPRTASPMPLVGLVGVLSLVLAGATRRLGKFVAS